MNKYHARKWELGGMTFDSLKEARRWQELRFLLRTGVISRLERQTPFELIPAQKDDFGNLLERAVTYRADFTYWDEHGNYIVEDVKSEATRTREYIIKRKLMLKVHGIRIREV